MNRDLTNYRKSYEKSFLEESILPDSPLFLFADWFETADKSEGVDEANAMTLTTIAEDGFPKARIVLLKHFDKNGFVFYTNHDSEKGRAMAYNNHVCVSFFWPNLERQVIIKGLVNKISEEESTTYFHSRPRGSQLGAWTSDQSTVIESRHILEEKLEELDQKYKGAVIPKPPFWGGYCIKPISFEFWQGRPNRLHDRILYTEKKDSIWESFRLSP